MSTRSRILEEARKQFNQHGVAKTSAKAVAKALEISDGNLRYHFRTKEDLVWALYEELVARFDEGFELAPGHIPTFEDYWHMLGFTFTNLEAYAFLMIDFAGVMRMYPKIRTHYRELQKRRKEPFMFLVAIWQQQGWLRTDLPAKQFDELFSHLEVFHDFWIPRAYMLYEGPEEERLLYHQKGAFAMLIPYLTPKGVAAWQQVKQV